MENQLVSISPKPKLLFLAEEISVWPSLESVYTAAKSDPKCEAQLVFLPFKHPKKAYDKEEFERYISQKWDIVYYDKYDLSKEAPDVVFYCKPYEGAIPKPFTPPEVEKIIDRMVYIPYGMEVDKRLIKYAFQHYLQYSAWRHIVYGSIVREFAQTYGYCDGRNIAVWGHPKSDIYRPEQLYDVPKAWLQKVRGRRVLMWCPHHTILPGAEKVSTWEDFSETIFQVIEKHPDIVLLWRPHPMLFGALLSAGKITSAELDAFVAEKSSKHNIILDTSADYRPAIALSDGLITDGTTFAIEYLYSGKPYMVTTHNLSSFYEPEAMEQALYIGYSATDVATFIEEFAKGKDPKRERRLAWQKSTLFYPDRQTVGEYIIQQTINELTQEEKQQVYER